jgi:hypothetical protein
MLDESAAPRKLGSRRSFLVWLVRDTQHLLASLAKGGSVW